jgi:endonuclease YncB( thermonuclease family)
MKLFIFSLFIVVNTLVSSEDFSFKSQRSLYIIDGDSVSLQMRIAGIDTPEIKQKCQQYANKTIDCGKLSKRYLQRLLKSLSGEISISPIGVDNYQRILVKIYKGDINIGKRMVESGMAYSYKNTYRQEEDLAKAEKLGFWAFATPPIKPYKWRKLKHR